MTDTINVRLLPTSYRRHPCSVCGGYTEKNPVVAEARDYGDQTNVFRVCETCLEAGDVDQRLLQHAARLEEHAQWLRSIVGHVRVPAYAEWQAECEKADQESEREWVASNPKEYTEWHSGSLSKDSPF